MAEAGDRTEKPTPKRREDARRKGQVLLSPEVSPVAVLLAALAVTAWGGEHALATTRGVIARWIAGIGPAARAEEPPWQMLGGAVGEMGSLLVPFFLMTAVVGTGAVLAQVGWAWNPELLAPDPSRVSPAKGVKRIFSAAGAMNLVKAIVKIAVVAVVAIQVLKRVGPGAISAPDISVEGILDYTGEGLQLLFLVMALALGVLGGLDYLWQRWRHEQGLRMTRQEVKDEHKDTEGDPRLRGRFRRVHREIAKRRMLAEVPRADVVLTNPIHVAVALRYRAEEGGAPVVLAKGAGEVAERIKAAARKAGVPIVERRALARTLHRTVAVGAEIPATLYRAVAEILAYVYSLRPARAEAR